MRAGAARGLGHEGPGSIGAGGVRDLGVSGEDGHGWRVGCFGPSGGAEHECEERCSVGCSWCLRLGRCGAYRAGVT